MTQFIVSKTFIYICENSLIRYSYTQLIQHASFLAQSVALYHTRSTSTHDIAIPAAKNKTSVADNTLE